MINVGVGVLLTGGIGGSGYNALMYTPFCVYISETVIPTPPNDIGWGAGGGSNWRKSSWNDDPLPVPKLEKIYTVVFITKITKNKTIRREFTVNENQKNYIIKRIGQINTYIIKFNAIFKKLSKAFEIKWKK